MRGADVYTLIESRMEDLEIDDAVDASQRWRLDDGQADDSNVRPDYTWELVQGQFTPSRTFDARTVRSVLQIRAYFVDGPGTGRRMLAAGERVTAMLRGLRDSDNYPHFWGVAEVGDWVPAEDDVPGQLVCTVDFACTYNLTGI